MGAGGGATTLAVARALGRAGALRGVFVGNPAGAGGGGAEAAGVARLRAEFPGLWVHAGAWDLGASEARVALGGALDAAPGGADASGTCAVVSLLQCPGKGRHTLGREEYQARAAGDSSWARALAERLLAGGSAAEGRLVQVSAIGVGESEDALPGPVKDAMKGEMAARGRAEAAVAACGVPQTVVRVGVLGDGGSGGPLLTRSPAAYGEVSSESLAEAVAACLAWGEGAGEVVSVMDKDRVLQTHPFVRPLEVWESLPFSTLSPSEVAL